MLGISTVYCALLLALPVPDGDANAAARYGTGRVFFQQVTVSNNDYQRNLKAIISDSSRDSIERAIARCELAVLTQDPPSARRAIEQELLNYRSPELLKLACRSALRCGDLSRGEQICKSILAEAPNNTDAQLLLAMISRTITPELREIAKSDAYAWIVMAQFYGTREEYPECLECAEYYLKEHDSGPLLQASLPHELCGLSLFKMGHRDMRTATALERAFQLMGECQTVPQKQKAGLLAAMTADCYKIEKKVREAYEWAKIAYTLDPESYDTNLALGLMTIELRKDDSTFTETDRQAIACLKKALSLKPSVAISVDLGEFLLKKQQLEEGALVFAQLVPIAKGGIDLDPSTAVVLIGALLSSQNENNLTQSQLDFSKTTLLKLCPKVVEIEPKNRKMYVACLVKVNYLKEATEVIGKLKELKQDAQLAEDISYLEKLMEFVKSKGVQQTPSR